MAFLFVVGEYMANGIAQGKLGLKICAVNHVVDTMQIASCQDSVLKGGIHYGLLSRERTLTFDTSSSGRTIQRFRPSCPNQP